MKRYAVKWQETRVVNVYAEVNAESEEAALKKAQDYDVHEDENEFLEENDSYTDKIHKGRAVEIKE